MYRDQVGGYGSCREETGRVCEEKDGQFSTLWSVLVYDLFVLCTWHALCGMSLLPLECPDSNMTREKKSQGVWPVESDLFVRMSEKRQGVALSLFPFSPGDCCVRKWRVAWAIKILIQPHFTLVFRSSSDFYCFSIFATSLATPSFHPLYFSSSSSFSLSNLPVFMCFVHFSDIQS